MNEGDLIQFSNVVFRLKRQNEISGVETLQGENCDQAMALIQFDRLMNERAHHRPLSADCAFRGLRRRGIRGARAQSAVRTEDTRPDVPGSCTAEPRGGAESNVSPRRTASPIRSPPTTPSLFVNTHPDGIAGHGHADQVHGGGSRGFPSLKITLEIHEAAVTECRYDAASSLRRSKTWHIGMAYDDFGSGQARLIELMEVPPDVLKFDIALTREVHRAPFKRKQMLKSLVTHGARHGNSGIG